jgi:hypothetical protein
MSMRETPDLPAGFWDKVNKTPTCWLWAASLDGKGYGQVRVGYAMYRAHRLAFADANGGIPPGMVIDHTCHVKSCVNPSHLQAVTQQQNMENRVGAPRPSISGVRGVHWYRTRNNWRVEVTHNRRAYFGGYFTSLADAEAAAIELRNALHTNNLKDRSAA